MFSVFSNIKQSGIIPDIESKKPSEIIKALAKTYGGEFNTFILCNHEDDKLYILAPQAVDVLRWINRRIIFELPSINYRTVEVRIRIASGMLNKLVYNNIIPKHIGIVYHSRLVHRIRQILCAINVEDLPF